MLRWVEGVFEALGLVIELPALAEQLQRELTLDEESSDAASSDDDHPHGDCDGNDAGVVDMYPKSDTRWLVAESGNLDTDDGEGEDEDDYDSGESLSLAPSSQQLQPSQQRPGKVLTSVTALDEADYAEFDEVRGEACDEFAYGCQAHEDATALRDTVRGEGHCDNVGIAPARRQEGAPCAPSGVVTLSDEQDGTAEAEALLAAEEEDVWDELLQQQGASALRVHYPSKRHRVIHISPDDPQSSVSGEVSRQPHDSDHQRDATEIATMYGMFPTGVDLSARPPSPPVLREFVIEEPLA